MPAVCSSVIIYTSPSSISLAIIDRRMMGKKFESNHNKCDRQISWRGSWCHNGWLHLTNHSRSKCITTLAFVCLENEILWSTTFNVYKEAATVIQAVARLSLNRLAQVLFHSNCLKFGCQIKRFACRNKKSAGIYKTYWIRLLKVTSSLETATLTVHNGKQS